MSSYSSTTLSSYDPASSSPEPPSSPSTTPGTTPPSPISLKHRAPTWKHTSPPIAASTSLGPRNRTLALDVRPNGIGVDPASLVGKQLTRVRRSRTHPCTTLHFSDGTAFQLLVVGYDPHYRGIPKVLESDSPILNPRSSQGATNLRLTISHAASITLSDKAFQARSGGSGPEKDSRPREDRWTQRHAAFALKFEEEQGWHCIWATMVEYDDMDKERCVFRNYADVYLDKLHASVPPASAPAHTTIYPPFPIPTPSPGTPKAQKHKRKNGKKKPGPNSAPKARW